MDIINDGSNLLKTVPEVIYNEALSQLKQMRAKHPTYRDDQLLMSLLCWYMEFM